MFELEEIDEFIEEMLKIEAATLRTLQDLKKLREVVLNSPENQYKEEGRFPQLICDTFLSQEEI